MLGQTASKSKILPVRHIDILIAQEFANFFVNRFVPKTLAKKALIKFEHEING